MFIVCCYLTAWGQTEKADSLLADFESRPSVRTANRFLELVSREHIISQPLHLSANVHPDTLRQQVWYWASEYYLLYQQYEQGTTYGLKALPLCEPNTDVEGDCLTAIAIAFFRMGNFEQALIYAKRCNEFDMRRDNPDNISSSFNLLAAIFLGARQYDEAEKCILRGLDYSNKADNPQRRAILLGMACEVYSNKRKYQEALTYGQQALELEQQLQRSEKVAVRQSQMAESLMGLGRFDEAKQLLLLAIPELRKSGNRHSLGIAFNQMGRLLLHDGDDSGAAKSYDEALQIFIEQKDILNESRSRRGLYESLRQSNPELAMKHNDRYNQLRDSIFDNETGMLLSQYAAQLDNEHLQAEKEEMRHVHRRSLYIAMTIILLLALITWFFSLRRQQRYHRRMTELTDEITRIRQQVTDIKNAAEYKKPDFNDQEFLINVITIVNDSMQTRLFGVDEIAEKMGLTTSTFRRRLQQVTGETPKAYITAIQMQKASSLLSTGEHSVNEVSQMCGFIEPSSFSRTFKRVFGITPSQFVQNKAEGK